MRHSIRLWLVGLACVFCGSAWAGDFAQDYNTAIFYYKRGEYELAAKSFESLVQRFPGDARLDAALYWSAKSYERVNRNAEAFRQYKALAERFPYSRYRGDALFGAGESAMKSQKYQDALSFFSGVIEEGALDTRTVQNARIRTSESLLHLGEIARADAALRDLIASPDLPKDQRHIAAIRLKMLLDREGAAGNPRGTMPAFPRVQELTQVEDYLQRGRDAFEARRYGEGRQWYEQVYRRNTVPGDIRAHALYQAGRASMEIGDADRARNLFEQAMKIDDAHPDVRGGAALYLANVYRTEGKTADVERLATVGERIAESSKQPELKNDMSFFRAESAYMKGRYDEALNHLAGSSADNFHVRRLRGLIRLELGQYDDAMQDLDEAARIAPDDDARNACVADRARIRALQKNYVEALTELGRLQNPSPSLLMQTRAMRADALYHQKQYGEAATEYGQLASATQDERAARRYRYMNSLAAFKNKNESWADKLLADLSAVGGNPEASSLEPAVYLDLAVRIDQAISFAPASKTQKLGEQIDGLLQDVRDTTLYAYVMERLRAKEMAALLPNYTRVVLESTPPASDLYGRAATYQVWAYDKLGNRDKSDESRALLESWASFRPSSEISEDIAYQKARRSHDAGDHRAALDEYIGYARQFPQGEHIRPAQYAIGMLALEEGREAEAEAALARFIELSPDAPATDLQVAGARRVLGMRSLKQNRPSEAVRWLEPVAGVEPNKSDPEFLFSFARALLAAGQAGKAETYFRRVIDHPKATHEQVESSISSLFSTLARSGQISTLESEYRKWSGRIRDPTRRAQSSFVLASMLFDAGRYAEAVPYFAAVTPPASDESVSESKIRLADCEFRLKKYQEAREGYARVISDHPNSRWADEANLGLGMAKIRLGLPEEALEGFERFLRENPNSQVTSQMAIESARLYMKAEDLDAVDRALKLYESKTPPARQEEAMRMRLAIGRKRGQHDRVVEVVKSFQKVIGFKMDIAVDGAVSATRIQSEFDPFDLRSRNALESVVKIFEEGLSAARAPVKTFAIDVRFGEGSGKYFGTENPVSCALKRILISESRAVLVVEVKLNTMLNTLMNVKINRVTLSTEDIKLIPDAFVAGMALGREFPLRYPQPYHFVISVPRDKWSDRAVIGLDADFGGYKSQLFARIVKSGE